MSEVVAMIHLGLTGSAGGLVWRRNAQEKSTEVTGILRVTKEGKRKRGTKEN